MFVHSTGKIGRSNGNATYNLKSLRHGSGNIDLKTKNCRGATNLSMNGNKRIKQLHHCISYALKRITTFIGCMVIVQLQDKDKFSTIVQ